MPEAAGRVAVLADLHGNLPALEAVLERLPPVDALLVAGDLAGGPWQNEVIARLSGMAAQLPLYAVLGNGDDKILALLEGPDQPRRLAQAYRFFGTSSLEEVLGDPRFAALRWFAAHLSPEARAFLESLPETRRVVLPGRDPILLVHGSQDSYDELILPRIFPTRFEAILAEVQEPVLVCAHSHEPWLVHRPRRLAFNPGAVSCPLDGRVGAQYAVMSWAEDGWQAELFHIPYSIEEVRRGYADSGLLESAPPAADFLEKLVRGSQPIQ